MLNPTHYKYYKYYEYYKYYKFIGKKKSIVANWNPYIKRRYFFPLGNRLFRAQL